MIHFFSKFASYIFLFIIAKVSLAVNPEIQIRFSANTEAPNYKGITDKTYLGISDTADDQIFPHSAFLDFNKDSKASSKDGKASKVRCASSSDESEPPATTSQIAANMIIKDRKMQYLV